MLVLTENCSAFKQQKVARHKLLMPLSHMLFPHCFGFAVILLLFGRGLAKSADVNI